MKHKISAISNTWHQAINNGKTREFLCPFSSTLARIYRKILGSGSVRWSSHQTVSDNILCQWFPNTQQSRFL